MHAPSDRPEAILPATVADYRVLAEKRLPRFLFDYIDGGANDERTLAANVDDFGQICIKQRVLRNVDNIDTGTTIAGVALSMPVVLAPVGMAGMFNTRGEVMGARAANAAGVPFTLSTVGICSPAEVKEAAGHAPWFQLYMMRDRKAVADLLQRAVAQGCTTLAFTVDLPMPGLRHRDTRTAMTHPSAKARLARLRQLATRPGWLWRVGIHGKPHSFGSIAHLLPTAAELPAYAAWIGANFDPTVTWDDIAWLRDQWKGKLILKGILEPDDARLALASGADGLVVSNHGARQLDSVASSISKLPAIVETVGGRMQVLLDGGVRSGLDVFKAVALGADAVMVGRPWIWAMAGAGEEGVRSLLRTWQQELRVAMALNGVTRIAEINKDALDVQ